MNTDSEVARELQMLEHNMQHVLMQKQTMQIELNEILNALNEIESSNDELYRVIGPVMVRAEKSKLRKELEERKKVLEIRLASTEKQESLLTSKIIDVRKKHFDASAGKN